MSTATHRSPRQAVRCVPRGPCAPTILQALAQIAVPRLNLAEPRLKALPEGVMAALSLLRVACGRRQLAHVLATKTSLVTMSVQLMSGNSSGGRARALA